MAATQVVTEAVAANAPVNAPLAIARDFGAVFVHLVTHREGVHAVVEQIVFLVEHGKARRVGTCVEADDVVHENFEG